jgi:hypothetical protein
MSSAPPEFDLHDPFLTVFLDRLQRLFGAMDRRYAEAAEYYDFRCEGCEENCCRTRFYHHTYLEYMYIHSGLRNLSDGKRNDILSRASEVCRKTAALDEEGGLVRLMCPLNYDGLCALYDYRPMICRFHGIPHELHRPDRNIIKGPGCGMFERRCLDKNYYKFDRTPFYIEMAQLENELQRAAGLGGRIKMTIAEMIVEKNLYNS